MKEETLLPFDTVSNNNNKNSTNVENNNQNTLIFKEKVCFMLLGQSIVLSLCCTGLILLILLQNDATWIVLVSIVILSILGIWCYMHLVTAKNLKLIKNEITNQLTITSTNVLGNSKHYTVKTLENVYLIYQRDIIILLNTSINPGEIDLDNSNIKNYPINLITKCKLYNGNFGSEDEIQLKIDEFLGQQKFENKIYDEINKYTGFYQNYKMVKHILYI